jgi:hypothetical protein
MTDAVTARERDQLVKLNRANARQAEREAAMREKVLLAETMDLLTAQFEAEDQLWKEAIVIATEAVNKANAQIAAQCAELGIPAAEAPQIRTAWQARGASYADRDRRAELRRLAEVRLAALTKTAKTAIQASALEVERQLVLSGLESSEARAIFDSLPTVEQLMPALDLDDLGVKRWQPPEDIAGRLTTPLTPAQRKRRQVLRAIEANPGASDRKIAQLANCDHKTVAAYRRERGEVPAITGDSPTGPEDDADEDNA